MVDTVRSKSALATLFADNTSGSISPQDLRDFLETMHKSYGGLYISASAATTPGGTATPLKALGTTTATNLRNFTMPANNRLMYTGTPSIHTHGVISFTSSTASANKTLSYYVYHYDDSAGSGAVIAHSQMKRRHSNTDVGTGALHFDVMLDTNDYIELWVANDTDTTNFTIDHAYMFILGMFM
jgi:hypothetical protein